jgi:DNA-binding HxlR family transcriptional regulator/putative sterol carrier protein
LQAPEYKANLQKASPPAIITGMTREYGQYCGLARALDLVGGRWSLLIVRELLDGPMRFTDLEEGLQSVPTNILSARLRELEDAGVIERTLLPRPSNAVVYGLTPYGKALEKTLLSLGLWGAQSLGRPPEGFASNLHSLTFPLRAMFQEPSVGEHRFQIRTGDDSLNIGVSHGAVCFPNDPAFEPDVILEMAPDVFLAILKGYDTVDSAIGSGRLNVHGSPEEARQFFEIFKMPAMAEAPR